MAYLEVLNGPEVGQKVALTQDTSFLGRDSNNHMVLSDRTVSRKHTVINQLDGQFVISDLKSLKGLLINGNKTGEAILEDGDEITLGAVRIRFHLGEKNRSLSVTPRKKSGGRWPLVVGFFLFLLLAGGLIYYFASSPSPASPQGEHGEIERHYNRGVDLLNREHDTAGAQREWQKVLELDPNKTTLFGQKASKLLENIPQE